MTATKPAARPASPSASLNPTTSAARPAARASQSHSQGAAPAVSPSGVVTSTGRGFQDGAPGTIVDRSRCRTSRPQTIQPQGSVVGADGASSESAASARQPVAGQKKRIRAGERGEADESTVLVDRSMAVLP